MKREGREATRTGYPRERHAPGPTQSFASFAPSHLMLFEEAHMDTLREHATSATDPHAGQPLLTFGPTPEKAAATLIMIHGRGASAQDILGLYPELNVGNLAAVAPQAAY